MKLSADWLKEFVAYDGSPEEVASDLTMSGLEVEKLTKMPSGGDHCLEVEITTNRPDWISHHGVAREIAAVQGKTLSIPGVKIHGNVKAKGIWSVVTEDAEKCPYYTAIFIEGIQSHETPVFMKKRLESCGHRSISLLVDITNYVMLETGQPLHVFDADLLQGNKITVRGAKKKEKFLAIDGAELELTTEDLVIADAKYPVALAGVMGGKLSEVSKTTKNVLLESAYFEPRTVRRTSQKHGLASDSSYRFERKVDPQGVDYARNRAIDLILEYAKPKSVGGLLTAGKAPKLISKPIHISIKDVEATLGAKIPLVTMTRIFKSLGLRTKKTSTTGLEVSIPSFRPDLTRPVDLIEEVARIYGYDKIEETLPKGLMIHPQVDPKVQLIVDSKKYLASLGLFETVTFSLISERGLDSEEDLPRAVKIVNPQHRELCLMRPTLVTSLLNVIEKNINMGLKDVHLFEVAHVYSQTNLKKEPLERSVISIALYGDWKEKSWLDGERTANFYDLKGVIVALLDQLCIQNVCFEGESIHYLDSEKCEVVNVGKERLGYFGELAPRLLKEWGLERPVFYAELDIEAMTNLVQEKHTMQDLPRFPAIERDLSVVVAESVKASEIEDLIMASGEALLKGVKTFDLFKGGRVPKGYKSLAFRLKYQADEKTLVSQDIQAIHEKIAARVTEKFEAKFQS